MCRSLNEQSVELRLDEETLPELQRIVESLADQGLEDLRQQGFERETHPFPSQEGITAPKFKIQAPKSPQVLPRLLLKYEGTDSTLAVDFEGVEAMRSQFTALHHQRYGFAQDAKALVVDTAAVEVIGHTHSPDEPENHQSRTTPLTPTTTVPVYTADTWHDTPVYHRDDLCPGDIADGPALIIESTGTNVVEPGWRATLTTKGHLILRKEAPQPDTVEFTTGAMDRSPIESSPPAPQPPISPSPYSPDPVLLEIFNNLFRAVAEEMGVTLQNTSYSVNIKERLDFSCALFDQQGELVANAPHIPVHLGSMGESVRSLIAAQGDSLKPGDVYLQNNPYNGGTHLPDITVITPVFLADTHLQASPSLSLPAGSDDHLEPKSKIQNPKFYVASRGHHADIGGITPGSMPPQSTTIEEEGVLLDNVQLVDQGNLLEAELLAMLTTAPYPVRNPSQNMADLRAQIAANEKGAQELQKLVDHYGLGLVQAYMRHVQDNAEECVRRVIGRLQNGRFTYALDDGSQIAVEVTVNSAQRSARIDFTGTSAQQPSNFNAPTAVGKAAVLYVFRTLVDDNIPLNGGCLKPLEIVIPEGSMLNPRYPAAVVAGNVEVSQAVTDALYGALGAIAASQGTMNNFTFGNHRHQYYETIGGGSGAGPSFPGTDAVHTHMTNSRLTDPEVLEWRFPVLLKEFSIRQGSGGAGQYPGGNGIVRTVEFHEPMTAAILSNHRRVAPFGLGGGEPGQVGENRVIRADGRVEELPGQAMVTMEPGDRIQIETPGGGGFGPLP
jgi:5-oxoprolinase (ATP-hydrolysing)